MRKASVLSMLLACVLAFIGPTAEAREIVELAPATNWVVDYADDSCGLLRRFGEPGKSAQLEMRQFSPGDQFQIIVTSEDFAWSRINLEMTVLPDSEPTFHNGAMPVDFPDGAKGFLAQISLESPTSQRGRVAVPAGEAILPWETSLRDNREAAITGILIERAFSDDLIIQTGSMLAPMNAMRSCIDELITHWGIDVDAHHHLRRTVQPLEMDNWSGQIWQHFPSQMARTGRQAALRIRLDVSADGLPTGCHHQIAYNHDQFEAVSCRILMSQARFLPALDASGVAINSYYIVSINYLTG